ncbi:fumarylacetoacetate hydrolase family protein [Herbaspirillum seropedicae]|uniref:Fumarylacetoacetate hydrolase family protein n=1 Tax=Herbaspirillum seropedicae (strain SmR1) TaxID=757424 RepID=D8J0X3_HERSS|nr:fumarylacetoacetate hydrolase family protein [Herbaspirillum seropedicae]ADJ62528.1 fumarylacetoacetate hydrolase family protein [Herbaspirillum seropedicae SmR1]AKN64644.1 fumarylacetoacetate hydrolase [Herbaspirillum seropedicae]NQE30935.1 fumarylacetoacetate hydrolase [Herbaspirillum seropedicae]UMU20583.1 fumarylacetoacetate hydrolase family protein [Herbaspirillum seropedicae]
MKLATLPDGSLDGALLLVSRDQRHAVPVPQIAASLLDAVQRWDQVQPLLQERYEALNQGGLTEAIAFDPRQCIAPLPRSPQWLDASAFLNHGRLMEEAFKTPPIPHFDTVPVMYQGASDDFLGPYQDVALPSEEDGIDFEGEFGVIVGPVPMGVQASQALQAVRLLVQINDWSLRALGPHEMKTGFGFLQAKPSTAFAPMAVTPDELGPAWRDGRVQMRLQVQWNGQPFGHPHGGEMNFSFGELIAHAARSRRLTAGTVIGSGTVSNQSRAAGSACIAERRVIEKIDHGDIRTGFMRFGDEVSMQACFDDGRSGPFGLLQQRVVPAR